MPKELDFKNLRMCIDNYIPTFLYIRLVASVAADQGREAFKIGENLEGKIFDFKKNESGLYLLVNSQEVFHFPLNDYQKGFSLAYERIKPTKDGIGRIIILREGVNPYNPLLPEPRKSTLRIALDNHLMEIDFKGRIDLKFHSQGKEHYWNYWTVDKPRPRRSYGNNKPRN